MVTRERLQELLDYDEETGVFTVKLAASGPGAKKVGEAIGAYASKDDAVLIRLDGRRYTAHNLAWLWMYGEWPAKQLIKLDGNGRNTAIRNLALPEASARGGITQDRLRFLLNYDRDSGAFTWRVRAAKNLTIGQIAGSIDASHGNRVISVDGIDYTAQRLAWLYEYGVLPDRPLRFLDGDQHNLRITNLALPEFDDRTPEGRREYQRAYRQRHFEVCRAQSLRKDFGMDADVYQHLFDTQGGVCAICGNPETQMRDGKVKWLAVDHCHESNAVRGLLCCDCNIAIGKMKDEPERLRAAAAYLEKNHAMIIGGEKVTLTLRRRGTLNHPVATTKEAA